MLVFPSLFIPKATRVLPGEFKILFTKIDHSSVKENNLSVSNIEKPLRPHITSRSLTFGYCHIDQY